MSSNHSLEWWSWVAAIIGAVIAAVAYVQAIFSKEGSSPKFRAFQRGGRNSTQISNNSGTVIIGHGHDSTRPQEPSERLQNQGNRTVEPGDTDAPIEIYDTSEVSLYEDADPKLLDKDRGTHFVEAELYRSIERLPKKERVHKSIIFIDVDDLTLINKRFGHEAGDRVLNVFANILKAQQPIAASGRCGDDTFFAYLPKADEKKANRVSDHIRKRIQEFLWWKVCPDLRVRCTCGFSVMSSNEDPHDWMARAIEGMLEGKRRGGNMVMHGPMLAGANIAPKTALPSPSTLIPASSPTRKIKSKPVGEPPLPKLTPEERKALRAERLKRRLERRFSLRDYFS